MNFPQFFSRVVRTLRFAFAFLTVIPVRFRDGEVTDADLAASRFAYPIVGVTLGLVLAALSEGLRRLGADPALTAFLLVAAGVGLSGALHLDGLADTADGLFLWGGPERRLAVMRDPHVGSFGVTALVVVLLGKYAALSALPGRDRARALVLAWAVSRTIVLVSAGLARYARPDGTGRVLIDATTRRDALGASLLILILGPLLNGMAGAIASVFVLIVAWSFTKCATRKLGGVTGDTLGALIELGELMVLVVVGLLGSLRS